MTFPVRWTEATPKPKPRLLDKRAAKAEIDKTDREESAKARRRANGRCEVIEFVGFDPWGQPEFRRCGRRDSQTHHLKGGIGRRNRGDSILAIFKLRTCDRCHPEITGHVLKPMTAEHTAETVRYERVR